MDLLHRIRRLIGEDGSNPMPAERTTQRMARVFVSSTFRDMQKERDILARAVFPRLREKIVRSGDSLYEVDLRWGVTAEQAENIGTLNVCLAEIDQCRPLFFCMLGERYGW